jgi:hydroxyacylglutathione hydrolase
VFTGDYEAMYLSLNKLVNLPLETLIFCAHEYTLSNLRFAKFVDPDNPAIDMKVQHVEELRKLGRFSVGSPMYLEREYNPFFTC